MPEKPELFAIFFRPNKRTPWRIVHTGDLPSCIAYTHPHSGDTQRLPLGQRPKPDFSDWRKRSAKST